MLPAVRHLLVATTTAVTLVAAGAVLPSERSPLAPLFSDGSRPGALLTLHDEQQEAVEVELAATDPHAEADPALKNAISRGGDAGSRGTADPTTAAQRDAAREHVARERTLPDPPLRTVPAGFTNPDRPGGVHDLAGGCYALAGQPVRFRAARLGAFLLLDADGRYLTRNPLLSTPLRLRSATRAGIWVARAASGSFTFESGDRRLRLGGTTSFQPRLTTGCSDFPEAEVNVTGDPHAGVTPYQEVRGYVDAHTHGMAFEFLGGMVHCGRPWHELGPEHALKDCVDHTLTGGKGALLESVLSGGAGHDPVGWPTFKDWPAPDSLTHEGTYYKWLERAWRGGQRLFVNLLTENNKLCELYPLKRNSCDDMDSVRLQAQGMFALQDYVDAQHGGPGKGWYRIVTSPWQAREVINAGKLAVVMGIETSVPFGCTFKRISVAGDQPACDPASIDRQLDEMHRLGVRQMELVNKFDNALSGVAGDAGATGVVVNAANFLETGSFWDMRHCEPADGESADKTQLALGQLPGNEVTNQQQDALFGAIGQLVDGLKLPALPLYGRPLHCNNRGLTNLGAHLVDSMMDRGMLIDPDHMSVKARRSLIDQVESRGYSGIMSSHSWSTPDSYPRIYALGGYVAPYAGDSTGFVDKWRRHLGWADPRYYFGFGFGADINGLGAQGNPRGADAVAPVSYPFTGFHGVRVDRQRAGQRTWDINLDGVAQYGLYPDWIEDAAHVAETGAAGGPEGAAAFKDDMARGAEAYLQTWERAVGVRPDSCRNPGLALTPAAFRQQVRPGMGVEQVLRAVGQPYQRLGSTFTHCTTTGRVEVELDAAGRVVRVR
ncbi:peptidase [Nocardioides solisilvae]|uniref:peptidase n=1 Tax=Nocardioides solisilvae TaxID=1542435 RepID=UPI000D74A3B0|nr:peptidase [Nocardioides solisilvae]